MIYYKLVKIIINAQKLAKIIINIVMQDHSYLNSIITNKNLVFTFKF